MIIGMLWRDTDALELAVQKAANYYERKYGAKPTLCFVNPAMIQAELTIADVRIKADKTIMPAHYWIGESNG